MQHGDDDSWSRHPDTLAAQEICLTDCPLSRYRACAKAARNFGRTPDDRSHIYPPAGIVAAGVICEGDADTTRALRRAESGRDRPDRLRCLNCDRALIHVGTPGEGEARAAARGLCKGCYQSARRLGTLSLAARLARPDVCTECSAPMVGAGQHRPDGHVIHHGHGQCQACAAKARRTAIAAATA